MKIPAPGEGFDHPGAQRRFWERTYRPPAPVVYSYQMKMRFFLAMMAVFFLALAGCGRGSFALRSAAFGNNERIPDKYCHGGVAGRENISLPFNWVNPPKGTQSFALVMHMPYYDGKNINWAVFNIPADCSLIDENASGNNMPAGSVELKNTWRTQGYFGPEPERGPIERETEYIATIYALNTTVMLNTGEYKSGWEIDNILAGKVIAKAEITGTYSISRTSPLDGYRSFR